jgi:hypothetical protein
MKLSNTIEQVLQHTFTWLNVMPAGHLGKRPGDRQPIDPDGIPTPHM